MSEDDQNAYYLRGKRLGSSPRSDAQSTSQNATGAKPDASDGHSDWENGPVIRMPCGAPVYLGYKICSDSTQRQKKKLDLASYHAHLEACFNQKGLCFYPAKK